MTDEEYGDFELLLELAPDWGIDSGVFLRTNPHGGSFQVYVDYRDHGNVGWLSTETRTGQKRMIIRPFNIFGKLDDRGTLTGFTTKPDEREIAWNPDYLLYSAAPEVWLSPLPVALSVVPLPPRGTGPTSSLARVRASTAGLRG